MANGAFKFKDNSGNVVSFISGSDSNISFSGGTLDLSGMTGLTLGNLTLSGTTQNALSASHAASYLLTSSFNTYSGNTNTVIGTLQTSTGSLNSFSSSTNNSLSSIETSTSSLNSFTSSATTRLSSIETTTGSLNSYTSSNNTRLGVIESTTGSLNSYTSSNTTNINEIHTSTSSLNSFTSSATTRLSSIEGVSGSYATTGSNQFKNDQVITGSLIVTGFIETQELRTTYISSSILFRSGSTKFGDELSDTHAFTGSMSVTGSLSVNGTSSIVGTGTSGQVAYFNGSNSITSNAAFAFTPTSQLLVNNSVTAASLIARGTNFTSTLVAAANNDVLVGLDIAPTFTNGAFTGVTNWGARLYNSVIFETSSDLGQGIYWKPANDGTTLRIYGSSYSSGIGYLQLNVLSQNDGLVVNGAARTLTINAAGTSIALNLNNIIFNTHGTGEAARIVNSSKNFLINTTTDAGFRLDVNGTARVQGALTGTSATFSSTVQATQYTATSTGGSGLRVYGASGTHQWDIYLNSINCRFSDNTGGGSVVFDTPITGTSATFTSNITINAAATNGLILQNSAGGESPNVSFITPVNKYNIDANAVGNLRFFTENTDGSGGVVRAILDSNGAATFNFSLTAASGIFNNGANSTDGIKIIGVTSSSAFTSGIEFIRTTVTGGSKIEPLRDIAIGGVGLNFLVTTNNTAEINATYTSAITVLNNGRVGINATNPLAGFQIEKYGSKFDSDNQYNQPLGNVFLSISNVVANQDNWIGIRGSYNSSSGSSNLLLQANYRDVNSQAGHYISSKATSLGVADFIIGKLVTSTSVSTPPTLVPQLTIVSSGAATFTSSVKATTYEFTGAIPSSAASTGYIDYFQGTRIFSVGTSGATKGAFTFIAKGADDSSIVPLSIASTGAATFNGSVTVNNEGVFGFQDFRTQSTQRVLQLRAEPVSGNYAQANFRFYTVPGTTVNGVAKLLIRSQYGSEAESGNLFSLAGDGNIEMNGTGALTIPKGTTAQRPTSLVSGMGRFNTTTSRTEFYNGIVWVTVGGTGDGSTSSSPASSAKAIKTAVGNPTSGNYWLQIPNVNSGNPFLCYCDFTMDGGIGYAIIYNQYFEGSESGPSHANFGSSTITTAGFSSEYQISPSTMVTNYDLTKLLVFARSNNGTSGGGIQSSAHYNWVAFSGPSAAQYNSIFTNGYNSTQFTGTFNSQDGNTGTASFPNSHGFTGGVTQISTNAGYVNDYILYEYKQGTASDPNHFWMVGNGRAGDIYFMINTRYGSSSSNVLFNRWGGVALH